VIAGDGPKRSDVPMDAPETTNKDSGRTAAVSDTGEVLTIIAILMALALFVYLIRFILLPFVIAGVIAYVCTPLLDWLARRTNLPRALFAVVLFLVLIGTLGLIIAFGGRHLVAEAGSTVSDLQGTLEHLLHQAAGGQPISLFGQTLDADAIVRAVTERLHDLLGQPDLLVLVTGYGFAVMIGTFLTAALLCYFLVAGRSVAHGLLWMVPPRRRALVTQIGARIDPVLKRYFLGILVIVVYAVIAAYIGLGAILGIDHAFLLALLTGILETIPIIGSTSAAVIAGLVSLHTATGIMSIAAFALYAVLLRLSIDQIVAPLVLGNAANVHPVLIIFCFLAGAVLLGIPGVILAVPTAITVKVTLATLYGEDDGIAQP
jgi:predicted PurR-regulated permease PerM